MLKLRDCITSASSACLSLLFATVLTQSSAAAASDKVSVMTSLSGMWLSDGPAFSKPGTAELSIQPVLDDKFYRLSYRVNYSEDNGAEDSNAVEFSGEAMYREGKDGEFTGSWADSSGDLLPIAAVGDATSLTATWGSAQTKLGRTTYLLRNEDTLLVTDELFTANKWSTFNTMEFTRQVEKISSSTLVSGIGGVFFRGSNPSELTSWYKSHFDIPGPPTSLEETPWRQESGYTIFSPFPQDSDYFGNPDKEWMLNFRVHDLDALVSKLRESGIEVSETLELPYGRFARLVDPEGNPIELWEPID